MSRARTKDALVPSGQSASRVSAGPSRTYPPPKPGLSNASSHPMAPSRPHPYRYQLAAFHSPMVLEDNNLAVNRVSIAQIPRDTSTFNHKIAVSHPLPQSLPQRTPSRRHEPPLPFYLRPAILFLTFLPIPPLLSLLYTTAGHAILRQSHKSSTSIYHAPIVSSVEAGATGGAILSLPIALLLYLIFPVRQHSVPEDFFEDDDSISSNSARWLLYARYIVCGFFLIGIGGIAGPLGVTCLPSGDSATSPDTSVLTRKMLSTGGAAAAGFVGGVVLSVAILLLGVLTTLVWSFCMKRHKPSS